MKEETHHLSPVGDEALEARIIAWVLGEASPFEAAELENLCEQQPEWRVFQRRMLAIHELLGEAHEMAPSAEWKLSAEKRGKLDELIGSEPVVIAPKKKVSYQKWITSIAAAILIGIVYQGAMGTMGTKNIVSMGVREESKIVAYSAMKPEAESAQMADSSAMMASEPMTRRTKGESKPSAPSASADSIAAATASAIAIPVPSEEGQAPTVAYGTGDTFGDGWGDETVAKNRDRATNVDAIPTLDAQKESVTFAGRTPGASAPASSSSAVIAGKALSDGSVESRKKMLEEVDRGSWLLTDEKQAAASKPVDGSGSGGGMTPAEFAEMEKTMAEGKYEQGGLAQREVIRRQAVRGPLNPPEAAASAFEDDPIRSNPAITVEGEKKVADVRRALYMGEGHMNLGKYEDATRAYENVLRIDPYNKAARRGLEKVAQQKSEYYRSAYDHTRSALLMEVDKAWELAIPGNDGKVIDPLLSELTPAPAVENKTAENAKADELLAKAQEAAPVAKKKEAPLTVNEISAEQEPYSTFSLRVSDNAFRIAQAAMAQGQRPAAESVRVEEFYNAFDYGDPVPTAQEPVAASIEQSAHPILPQRNLLRIALRTAASGRSAGQPLHLTLLVDQSGSMSRGDRSAALLAAVKELSSLLQAQDHVSVIGFSRTPRLLAEKIPGNQPQRLVELLSRIPSDGGTNLEEALKLGEIVAKRNQLAGAQNRLLLLTDGAANLGNADPDRLAAWVKELRQKNIAFDIAGIGTDGLNDPLLVEIARHGNGRYYVINDAVQAKQQFAAQLAGAFRPAAENVKVQVQFNPKRVGKYQLIGFEKDRLNTEDFRNDQVDAAEMAAAEAGQALYQVELLPDGVGDIGEVSVRFRDVATQQMVERKWTMRYDATTPVFERALPTMQLAGLSMLTAQKLQGGPMAPMIRFSEMPQAQQQLREVFSASPRVSELLEMIRQLND